MAARIGLLMVGHVDPKSVDIAGDYPQLFADLLAGHDVELVRYDVDLGRLPDSVHECDGWMCGPSRSSAYDDLPWQAGRRSPAARDRQRRGAVRRDLLRPPAARTGARRSGRACRGRLAGRSPRLRARRADARGWNRRPSASRSSRATRTRWSSSPRARPSCSRVRTVAVPSPASPSASARGRCSRIPSSSLPSPTTCSRVGSSSSAPGASPPPVPSLDPPARPRPRRRLDRPLLRRSTGPVMPEEEPMIRRVLKNLSLRDGEVPDASRQLETDGWAVLPGVLDAEEARALGDGHRARLRRVRAGAEPRRPRGVPLRDAEPQRGLPGRRSATRGSSR